MPHQPTVTRERFNSVIASLRLAVPLLDQLNNAFGAFSLHAISQTILSLIAVLQNVKKNKVECIQLVENIHQVLYAIINLHVKSDTPGSLPLSMLYHVGKFTETIHKIHTFLEAQQDGNRIKNLFRQKTADNLHEELLEMISSLSDGTDMDKASSNLQASSKHLTRNVHESQFLDQVEWEKQALQELFYITQSMGTHGVPCGRRRLLSLLTDIAHLALLITMRGAERPGKVRWTHPFLEPLKPLSDDAARQTFLDIADDFHEPKDIQSVLSLTNNMPLAVDLIAHLVDNEGCPSVLARWETEKTGLLSVGHDRRSNIDISIGISLSSPRLTSSAGAMDLLRLLSVLPDGLSDIELLHSDLAIQDILTCKVALLTSPPSTLIPHSIPSEILSYSFGLYEKHYGSQQMATSIHQIKSNFGNLNQILLQGLHANNTDTTGTIILTGREWLSLMDEIPNALPQPCNHKLEASSHIQHFNDPVLEALFYRALAYHYNTISNYAEAIPLAEKALSLVKTAGVTIEQPRILNSLANLLINTGAYISAQKLAIEAQMYARLSANLQHEAEGLGLEARCCRESGNYKHSVFLLQRGRELLRLCGLSGCNIDNIILNNEANTLDIKSEYNKAKLIHIQIAQTTSPTQDVINHAYALLNIADLDITTGGSQHDVNYNLDKANGFFSSVNEKSGMVFCEIQMARLKLREGDTLNASPIFLKYLQWPSIGNHQISSHCLDSLADIDSWAGINFHQKFMWTAVYLAHASKFHGKLALHKALLSLGKVFLADGDEWTAENLFTVALDGFTFMDIHRSRADCMLCLGDIAKKQGHLVKASALWTDARPLFEQSLQAKDVSRIDSRLADSTTSIYHDTAEAIN
ncbi:hypothetical protein B0H13DRAFT_1904799 [Mycena leptocephala]|nr:hypothetical protein B0H13DRAFT_1904799 [Mycena leptocephala]